MTCAEIDPMIFRHSSWNFREFLVFLYSAALPAYASESLLRTFVIVSLNHPSFLLSCFVVWVYRSIRAKTLPQGPRYEKFLSHPILTTIRVWTGDSGKRRLLHEIHINIFFSAYSSISDCFYAFLLLHYQ